MHIYLIACRVMTRDISALVADSPNRIDVAWLPQGMHDTPEILHQSIEAELERLYEQIEKKQIKHVPDIIALGYGLCSKATVGLKAERIPLAVPRTDDCIGLFLGSEAQYLKYFNDLPGTFWLNAQWIENGELEPYSEESIARQREELMEEYDDEEAVDYLIEMQLAGLKNYCRVGFIGRPGKDESSYSALAKAFADEQGMEYAGIEGSDRMFRKMIAGEFDDEDFLIVKPGEKVAYSNGPERMKAVPV